MEKSSVYSWRISPDTRSAIEHEARVRGESVAQVLDRVVNQWIEDQRRLASDDDAAQDRIRAAAASAIGALRTGDPTLAERAGDLVKRRIIEKHGR